MLYGGPVAEAAWQRVFAEARNLDSWAACRAMAAQAVATVPARRVDAILNGMSGGGYINREDQEELLRGAAAAGLSAEHQANFIAGSDTVGEQQSANAQDADAVVLGAAGAAAQLAHAARAALRGISIVYPSQVSRRCVRGLETAPRLRVDSVAHRDHL